MAVDVVAELGDVDFAPATEAKEILQNVKTILSTVKGSVPMDRAFGVDGIVTDLPVPAAQARMTSEIVAAVRTVEPRAKVVSVSYEGDENDGEVRPRVRLMIDGT